MEQTRLFKLQSALLREIDKYSSLIPERDQSADWERLHLASCARLAWLLALQRGVNPELAACACSCHDYGRIVTGRQKGHAEAGYEPVKAFLSSLNGLFSEDEIELIALAVKNHSSKSCIGTPIEEIVKDADVIDCYQYGAAFTRAEQQTRYDALKVELDLHDFT